MKENEITVTISIPCPPNRVLFTKYIDAYGIGDFIKSKICGNGRDAEKVRVRVKFESVKIVEEIH